MMTPEQWGMLSRALAGWVDKHANDGKSERWVERNFTVCRVVVALSQVADEMSYQTAVEAAKEECNGNP